jgi:hypothetical protein
MRHESRFVLTTAAAALLAVSAGAGPALAAVSSSQSTHELILSIIEDPDPVPVVFWQSVPEQDASSSDVVDLEQIVPGSDDRPYVGRDPRTGYPVVVWARHTWQGRDIAARAWTGDAWTDLAWVFAAGTDDRDPQVWVDPSGVAWTVWWTSGTAGHIYLARQRSRDSAWEDAELIEVGGRRPSLVHALGVSLLAYEADAPAGGQDIIVRRTADDGSSARDVVATTERTEPLDPFLHSESGKIWIDWKHAEGSFAYSVFDGARWARPAFVPWYGGDWNEEMAVREAIRSLVIAR